MFVLRKPSWGSFSLIAERPPELHRNQVGLGNQAEIRTSQDSLPAAIPDNEQVIPRLDCPAETGIGSDVLRIRVVLDKAGQDQVGIPRIRRLSLPESLHEVPLRHVAKVILGVQLELYTAFG